MELFAQGLALAIAVAVAWGLWRAAQPEPYFVVAVVRGEVRSTAGTVTSPFLQRVHEVATEHRIATGRVWGVVRQGGRISLNFSRHFPPPARQQLRNWWGASGWAASMNRNKCPRR
ncbi:: DUF3634 [Gemmata massiliana]|uniref:: DUF3634 n=1 Tax=Gemmata massiliana TaxID=1210884 RepID=A0A6P2D2L5_9BACT|nr:DUF3634 family protein [Gemmata massiliana]VTR93640.1 : DUF3634 [Gemmata massiliana]